MEGFKAIHISSFSLIPKVLCKAEKEETPVYLIILPLTQHPVILPSNKTLLSITNTSKVHPLWKELRLVACNLSRKTLLIREIASIVVDSWINTTRNKYASVLQQFKTFCIERKINPLRRSLTDITVYVPNERSR